MTIPESLSPDAINTQRHRFDLFNVERVFAAMSLFSAEEATVFSAVPLMLHYNFSGMKEIRHSPDTPGGICSFWPKEIHTKAFTGILGDVRMEKTPKPPVILSLALIGSLGTVAQTHKSDFDYVVFVEKKSFTGNGILTLRRKLTHIERWIYKKMGVETHFFIQDLEDFRQNRFGLTDRENVGSALGRLFKDEFYRTAIWIAGKKPLWWILPPGYPESGAENFHRSLGRMGIDNPDEYFDPGHILHAEPEEFFGAALWQLNKALNSPFKSLLKMGLLESYLFDPGAGLLCEEVKIRVATQNAHLQNIDPYAMMFERASGHYTSRGMPREASMMKGAFLLKTGITAENIHSILQRQQSGLGEKERRIVDMLRRWGWSEEEAREMDNLFAGNPNLRYKSIGNIYRFFLDAYVRLSNWLRDSAVRVPRINEDDLTVLGRKLFTHFERTPGKIHFIHESSATAPAPERLTLMTEKTNEGERIWSLYEGTVNDALSGTHPPIARYRSTMEILAWMVVNRIWKPETRFYFRGDKTPYKAEDAQEILAALYAFFGPHPHYDPTREDYLSEKRGTKAFIVPNYGLRETPKEIRTADIVFLDTWGEFTWKRMTFRNALAEVAQMATRAKRMDKPFELKVVSPPSQNDPRLAQEFEHSLQKMREVREYDTVSLKKSTLDLS